MEREMASLMNSQLTVNSRTTISEDSPADMEVFKEIDKEYFSESKEYDASRYILERIPSPIDCTNIEEILIKLKRQQQVVSSKALHLITQQRESCDKEFEAILKIQEDLDATINTCRNGRHFLKAAKTNLTSNSYGILGNYRKSQTILGLLKSLRMIRKLCQAEEQVQNLFKNREFETAVQLILSSQKEAAKNKEYKCVAALLQRLQDSLEFVEEQLDGVLAEICLIFDEETYSKLQKAYALLDKTQVAMDQLHMHFASAINSGALEVLRSHQKEESDTNVSSDQIKLKDLCLGIKETSTLTCLLDLCDRLWLIMLSYYKVVEWHSKHDDDFLEHNVNVSEFEMNVSKEYVKQKLQNGLMRIWQDVQSKISVFLIQSGLPNYNFEKFIQVLGILKRLMDVAREFCGDISESLQNFIKSQSLTYLKNYHAGRMEVLRIFLENEAWELCPVKSKFNALQLQEYEKIRRPIKKFLDSTDNLSKESPKKSSSEASSSVNSQDDSLYIGRYFTKSSKHTPFDIFRYDTSVVEDILEVESEYETNSEESEDEPEELTRDFVDENPTFHMPSYDKPNSGKQKVVIVTNTTLSVLRDCGQYLQMCRFLQPISFEVIMLMSQMFDYYLYAVHLFFVSDLKVSSSTLYSSKLTSMLKRIRNNLASSEEEEEFKTIDPENNPRNQRTLVPQALHIVNLSNPENLNGLCERIVAVESLVFLAKQFIMLQPYLENSVPLHQKIILQTFYQQTVSAAMDIRLPVYMCVASQAFNVRNILIGMSQVNWEVKNIMSQHSNYVDLLVRDIQVFSMRLDIIGKRVPISSDVYKSIWSCISKFIVHTLVEGFSNVSKCSDSGRGLMQLDYTQLLSNMEKISGLKPMPHYEYVDTYVKAYYIGKPSLEDFIKHHTEYSVKHLTALVNCVCDTKKSKQELISLIELRDN